MRFCNNPDILFAENSVSKNSKKLKIRHLSGYRKLERLEFEMGALPSKFKKAQDSSLLGTGVKSQL